MFNFYKNAEIFISFQLIVISAFIPAYIWLPFTNKLNKTFEIPLSWQIPTIIIISLIFKREIVVKAFSLYLFVGLFFLPIFHNGGSLGYLLTSNFGYLLGIYPLILVLDKLKRKNHKINYNDFLRYGIFGISIMHITGIIYSSIQLSYFNQLDTLLYDISKYSFGKLGYHLLMLTPITLFIKLINKNYKYDK